MYVSVLKKKMLKAMVKNEDIKYCENDAFLEQKHSWSSYLMVSLNVVVQSVTGAVVVVIVW
jgi:hypothetical protein